MNDTTNIAWRFTTVVPFDCGDDGGWCWSCRRIRWWWCWWWWWWM